MGVSIVSWAGCAAAALLIVGAALEGAHAEAQSFANPEAAVAAFRSAVEKGDDGSALVELLGPEHRSELVGGDPGEARHILARLRRDAGNALRFEADGPERGVLLIGVEAWPMPIPLVKTGDAWRFDAAEGLEEIHDRRVGRHELAAIELAQEFADAQMTYADVDRDGDQVLEYAQRILSEEGTKNGLYWPDATGDDPSPFGEFVARAEATGYRQQLRLGDPYRGYFFRVLTKQGRTPPGGAYDYVINGNMIAGFAVLAWPAEYGVSGVMSFVANQQGKVFQKDLGADTEAIAAAIEAYDPGDGWSEVTDTE